jgi:hypothetical protein
VALGRRLGIPDLFLAAVGIAMAVSVRGRDSVAWLGIALLIATPSVHGYTFLFLLPGLLTIRRDWAILLATLFLGVYHAVGWWMACLLVVYFLVASGRWTWLRRVESGEPHEPASGHTSPNDKGPEARTKLRRKPVPSSLQSSQSTATCDGRA